MVPILSTLLCQRLSEKNPKNRTKAPWEFDKNKMWQHMMDVHVKAHTVVEAKVAWVCSFYVIAIITQ